MPDPTAVDFKGFMLATLGIAAGCETPEEFATLLAYVGLADDVPANTAAVFRAALGAKETIEAKKAIPSESKPEQTPDFPLPRALGQEPPKERRYPRPAFQPTVTLGGLRDAINQILGEGASTGDNVVIMLSDRDVVRTARIDYDDELDRLVIVGE